MFEPSSTTLLQLIKRRLTVREYGAFLATQAMLGANCLRSEAEQAFTCVLRITVQ